jgi:hypothetical protein
VSVNHHLLCLSVPSCCDDVFRFLFTLSVNITPAGNFDLFLGHCMKTVRQSGAMEVTRGAVSARRTAPFQMTSIGCKFGSGVSSGVGWSVHALVHVYTLESSISLRRRFARGYVSTLLSRASLRSRLRRRLRCRLRRRFARE